MTLQEARENLAVWREAQRNIAVLGQSYKINDRMFTAANLAEINKMVRYWEGVVQGLESGRGARRARTWGVVPSDL